MKPKSAAVLFSALFCITAGSLQVRAQASGSNVITMVNVPATLEKTIDAKKSKAGDPVTAKVSAATQLGDGTKVPSGSMLTGHIDSVTPSENKGDSTVVMTFDKLQIKNGVEASIKATVVSVTSMAPGFGSEDRSYDPSSYRPGSQGDNKSNGSNNQGGNPTAPHPIDGLTLSGTPQDATSATLTEAKKNLHLSSGVLLVVSVALLPNGAASR
jgi:hypothetical protein